MNDSASLTHRRRSIRLKDYDYTSQGAYFVTIVSHERLCLFGEILDGVLTPTVLGEAVQKEWLASADIRSEISLDTFVVMPNHLHGIVMIARHSSVGAHGRAPLHRSSRSLGSFVAGFKSAATKRINRARGIPGAVVWQRGFYDHIIRNDESLNRIRQYVEENPLRWAEDPENPFWGREDCESGHKDATERAGG